MKDIRRQIEALNHLNNIRQLKPGHPIFNQALEKIIELNETDYEELWDNRVDYWLHNWGDRQSPSQMQTPLNTNKNNDINITEKDNNNYINLTEQVLTERESFNKEKSRIHHTHLFGQKPPKNLHEFRISKQQKNQITQYNTIMDVQHMVKKQNVIFISLKPP